MSFSEWSSQPTAFPSRLRSLELKELGGSSNIIGIVLTSIASWKVANSKDFTRKWKEQL